jgi:sterol desaturase/sphingolipid hydroxylase (fatty acid hydroxylase superfamily)
MLADTLREPVVFAIPFFLLVMVLEAMSLRHVDDGSGHKGYEYRDSRASILMSVGSLVVSGAARIVALLAYTVLWTLSPLRLDPHEWWVWVYALLAVDLLFYLEHRAAHRVRILWAGH